MTRKLAWAVALIGIASQLSLRAALTEELHKTYPLDAEGRVSLNNVHGDVRISAWDRNEVQVDAVKTASSKEILDEANIVIDSSSGSISIRTRYPDPQTRRNPATVEYTLKVPRRARLFAVECVHGNVEIAGVVSDVKASTVHGSVTARNLAGEARLSSVHGNVDAGFDRIDGASSISMNTVHGNIDLALPNNAGLDVNASTVHGRIASDLGTGTYSGRKSRGSFVGRTGDGASRVKLNTVHGDIRIVSMVGGRRIVYV
jgi:DUF4097 and DUF4098 domain-containing protein YvlB